MMLDRWAWIIILSAILVVVVPLIVIWFILQIPPVLRMVATIIIFIVWGIVSGYKDWVIYKRREAEARSPEA